jgi:small subunit ribosomal protein S13
LLIKENLVARIAGVNVPTNKRVHIALTYVHGIGLTGSKNICKKVGVTEDRRINNLSEDELTKIRDIIDEDYLVEGDLRRKTSMDIKRYLELIHTLEKEKVLQKLLQVKRNNPKGRIM